MRTFDPYQAWLDIPPHEQPPTHYRLLGLSSFEGDNARVMEAADARMGKIRTYQLGPNGPISQKILNELSKARVTLLDEKRRAAYDAVLKSAAPAISAEPQDGTQIAKPPQRPATANPAAPAPPAAAPGSKTSTGRTTTTNKAITQSQLTRAVAAAPPGELVPGTVVGKYRIVERVSTSALGRIDKAQHIETGHFYFLKTLPPDAAKKEEVRKRFAREIEIVTKLDHPNMISGIEAGDHNGQPYLVMEYVLGTDLATLVHQHGTLSVDEVVDYVIQTAKGLTQLHLHGVFHRNIRPHVLLVDTQGNLRITNLLLAKLGETSTITSTDNNLTVQGQSLGSYDFQAPEQTLDAREADARSDLYSLGCTLHYLLTGHPPYVSDYPMQKILAHQSAPIPLLSSSRPDVPDYLERVFEKLLAKEPAARFQFAGDLVDALENPGKGKLKLVTKSATKSPASSSSGKLPWLQRVQDFFRSLPGMFRK